MRKHPILGSLIVLLWALLGSFLVAGGNAAPDVSAPGPAESPVSTATTAVPEDTRPRTTGGTPIATTSSTTLPEGVRVFPQDTPPEPATPDSSSQSPTTTTSSTAVPFDTSRFPPRPPAKQTTTSAPAPDQIGDVASGDIDFFTLPTERTYQQLPARPVPNHLGKQRPTVYRRALEVEVAPGLETVAAKVLTEAGKSWMAVAKGWTLRFEYGTPGLAGKAIRSTKTIYVYFREGDTVAGMVHTTLHEAGHILDFEHLSSQDKNRWMEQRSPNKAVTWYPLENLVTDLSYGAGDFAEVFAAYHLPGTRYRSSVAPRPNQADLDLMGELIRSSTQ